MTAAPSILWAALSLFPQHAGPAPASVSHGLRVGSPELRAVGLLPGDSLPGAGPAVLACALCSNAECVPACRAPVATGRPCTPRCLAASDFILGPFPACASRCASPVGGRSLAHGCAPGGQLPGAAPAHDTVCLRCAVGVHHSRCVPSMGPRSCSSNSVTVDKPRRPSVVPV